MPSKPDENAFFRWLGYMPHLEGVVEIELLALKVHIIAEDALRHLLAMRLGTDERAVEKMDLRFEKLARLALTGTASDSLLEALLALNSARNKAAHKLDDTVFQDWVERFINLTATFPNASVPSNAGKVDRLRAAGNDTIAAIFDLALPFWKD